MKIIILGGGRVGGSLAESLASEKIDITVIDSNEAKIRELQDRLDIGCIHGHAAHPDILRSGGLEDADMLVAVTGSDEINMIACQIAHSLYRTPTKICRIRATSYINQKNLFNDQAIPIDVIISPGKLATNHIKGLLEHPGSLQVLNFANGAAQLIAIRAHKGDRFVGHTLYEIHKMTPDQDARVAAIFRGDSAIEPSRETVIQPNDEVFYIAAKDNIRPVMKELGQLSKPYKKIMIAGGGNIGLHLAQSIEDDYDVKIIEAEQIRAQTLSESLNKAIVLHGNVSDTELLNNENIEKVDVFIALTNDDEANIMSSLLAKKMGARKVITLINNTAYINLVQGEDIDVAFAPQLVTLGSILAHVRKGDMAAVHSLRRGAAEALEIIAHGDEKNSNVIGKKLADIRLPEGVRIGAIVRDNDVLIAHRDVTIQPEDHVVVFLVDKTQIPAVEKLFHVGLGFF